MLSPSIQKYLRTRAVSGPWRMEGDTEGPFLGAVVIPSFAEGDSLLATLASLAEGPPDLLERFLVLVVVNHRRDAGLEEKASNLRTLERLKAGRATFPRLRLAWVDAASPGRELPLKDGGVGLARKIGFDLALSHLDFPGDFSPVLVGLDADTLVRPTYLEATVRHFETASEGAAVLPFWHQEGRSPLEQQAIEHYELFLRHYVLGLSLAGSPYAFHTVGSAMACRAEAYVRAGGMNRRQAGEDFYFLQQAAKTCGVGRLLGTMVYPSARPSRRTPFGTGRSVSRWLAGEKEAIRFYRAESFGLLGAWLHLAKSQWHSSADRVLASARDLSAHLGDFLETIDFADRWAGLQRNHRRQESFLAAFHTWFDGLRTIRFIHRLGAGPWPPGPADQALPELLLRAGLDAAKDVGSQLALLRRHQVGPDFAIDTSNPLETSSFYATMP